MVLKSTLNKGAFSILLLEPSSDAFEKFKMAWILLLNCEARFDKVLGKSWEFSEKNCIIDKNYRLKSAVSLYLIFFTR